MGISVVSQTDGEIRIIGPPPRARREQVILRRLSIEGAAVAHRGRPPTGGELKKPIR